MSEKPYCRPRNAGLASETLAVARRLAKLFNAMRSIDQNIIDGEIVEELRSTHYAVREKLEAEGWTISTMNGMIQPTKRWHVYPPGSDSGKRIRRCR